MGLLDTSSAHGEPFSYEEPDKKRVRPADGSTIPLENTDMSVETLRNISNASPNEELKGELKEELKEERFHLGAGYKEEELEVPTVKVPTGSQTGTQEQTPVTMLGKTTQPAEDTSEYHGSNGLNRTNPEPINDSNADDPNADTKLGYHTYHDTTSIDSFKDALEELSDSPEENTPWDTETIRPSTKESQLSSSLTCTPVEPATAKFGYLTHSSLPSFNSSRHSTEPIDDTVIDPQKESESDSGYDVSGDETGDNPDSSLEHLDSSYFDKIRNIPYPSKFIRKLSHHRDTDSSDSSVDSRDDFSRPVQYIDDNGIPEAAQKTGQSPYDVSDPEEISAPALPKFESLNPVKPRRGRKGRRRSAIEKEANQGVGEEPETTVKKTVTIDEPDLAEIKQSIIDSASARQSGESSRSRRSTSKDSKSKMPHISRAMKMMNGLGASDGSRSGSQKGSESESERPKATRTVSARSTDSANRSRVTRILSSFRHPSVISTVYPPHMDLNLPQGRVVSEEEIHIHHPMFHQQQRQLELEEQEDAGWSCLAWCHPQKGHKHRSPWNVRRWHTESDWNTTFGFTWPWKRKPKNAASSEIGEDLQRDSERPCIRVRGDPGPNSTIPLDNMNTLDTLASLGECPDFDNEEPDNLACEEAQMLESGQYWGVVGDNPKVLPLSEAASQRGMVMDVIYENQRGGFLFGRPFFSSNILLNFERMPWTTIDNKAAPGDPQSHPLPNTNWQWVWKYWYIDMSGDVDDHGWSYSWLFRSKRWHGSYVWMHSWVRRRRWIRVRKLREFNRSEAITGRLERPMKIHDSLLHVKQCDDDLPENSLAKNQTIQNFMHAKFSALVEVAACANSWGRFWQVFTACRLDRERTAVTISCIRERKNGGTITRLAQNPSEITDQYQFSDNIGKLCTRVLDLVRELENEDSSDGDDETVSGDKPLSHSQHLECLQQLLSGIEEQISQSAGFYSRLEQAELQQPATASTDDPDFKTSTALLS